MGWRPIRLRLLVCTVVRRTCRQANDLNEVKKMTRALFDCAARLAVLRTGGGVPARPRRHSSSSSRRVDPQRFGPGLDRHGKRLRLRLRLRLLPGARRVKAELRDQGLVHGVHERPRGERGARRGRVPRGDDAVREPLGRAEVGRLERLVLRADDDPAERHLVRVPVDGYSATAGCRLQQAADRKRPGKASGQRGATRVCAQWPAQKAQRPQRPAWCVRPA